MAHRLSCPTACGILVPRPGIEPASPPLEGGFFTTGPPGKSHKSYPTAAVPNLFGTRDWFHGRQFFHGQGWRDGSGGNASDGEQQMKFRSFAHRSPPAVWPGSYQAADHYRWLWTPVIQYLSFCVSLISFSIIPSKSIHVVANGKILFFFMAK